MRTYGVYNLTIQVYGCPADAICCVPPGGVKMVTLQAPSSSGSGSASSSSKSGPSAGAIAGIVIGILVLVILLAVLILAALARRRKDVR